MEQEKKRRGRRAHLDDFQKTASGDYVYSGKLHPFKPGVYTRKQALLRLWLAAAGLAAALAAAGCIPVAGMRNTFYVILPYAASLLAAVSVVWLMCRLTAGGDPLRDYVYAATVAQFRLRSTVTAVLCAAALAGEGLCLALNGPEDTLAGSVVFLLCEAAGLALSLVWRSVAVKLDW